MADEWWDVQYFDVKADEWRVSDSWFETEQRARDWAATLSERTRILHCRILD